MNLLVFFSLIYIFSAASLATSDRPLEGLKLRCCTLIEKPVVYDRQTGGQNRFDGLAIDYLKVLEDRLGFRCESLQLFDANRKENQGFTGFVLEMEECTRDGRIIDSPKCRCDMGVGGWVLNEERLGRVDFLPSYLNDDLRMLTHVDNINSQSKSGTFFITAFSPTIWIAVFGLVACFIFLKLLDQSSVVSDPGPITLPADSPWYRRVKHLLLKSRLLERLKQATKNTLLEVIGQPTDDAQADSQTSRQWLLRYILLLCGLFLILAYEATMTASLVQEIALSDFRTLNDLKECRVKAEEVCVPDGGAALAFWEAAIAKSDCNQGAPTIVKTYAEGHLSVVEKKCKYFLASGATTRDAANGRYCGRVMTTGEPFSDAGLSFLLPKGSNLTATFSHTTLQLRRLDGIDSIEQYLRRRGECSVSKSVSLTFKKLEFFFILAYSAIAFMFLFIICFPHRKRQQQNTRGHSGITEGNNKHSEEFEFTSEASTSREEV